MPARKTSGTLFVLMAAKYAKISTALPSAPPMNTGLRPMRSESVAHAGIATSATALAEMPTQSIVDEGIPTVLVAYARA